MWLNSPRRVDLPVLLVAVLALGVQEVFARKSYTNSYVFLSATNRQTGHRSDYCANYLQYRSKPLPDSYETAKPLALQWWRDLERNTKICPLPSGAEMKSTHRGAVVPLNYRIDDDGSECTKPFSQTPTAFRYASKFMVQALSTQNTSTTLFLLDRGRQFVLGWRDYLFADFTDPYIDEDGTAMPTYFIYAQAFDELLLLGKPEDVDLRFFRPKGTMIDLSMVVIWLIAMVCVGGGGFWAFYRHKHGKDQHVAEHASSSTNSAADENSCCNKYANYIAIAILMMVLVSVITLGYFFRSVLVFFFNVMLVVFGTMSVHGCTRALLSNFWFSGSGWYQAEIGWTPSCTCGRKFSYSSFFVFLLSMGLCVFWFFTRLSPYAFVLLDFINITLCLHILKSLRLPSLKWISILMMCMFVYDAVMVFATPMWTRNGCSVMLEVATGIDCSTRGNSSGYPLPPIDAKLPEKFPMLMQVMHFDPMLSCIDLSVERGFQMTILGLGDIIIPGYLVSHCFTMNGFDEKTRLIYGAICVIGYGVGLVATFIALTLMNMAQPALIYLVPFTLLPVCLLALARGDLRRIWHGVPMDKGALISEENHLNGSSRRAEENEYTNNL